MTTDQREDYSLTIAEVYGLSAATGCWQGEGASAGRRCSFVRLGGCNLTCGWARVRGGGLEPVPGAWQCDEPKTWHSGWNLRETLYRADAAGVAADLTSPDAPHLVVLTGGEPLLHQDAPGFGLLLGAILDSGRCVEVETNGTITPRAAHRRIRYNVSPKLAGSGLPLADRHQPDVLAWHAGHASAFKFVVTCPADVDEAAGVAHAAGADPERVWIMPEGITAARVLDVARDVAPVVAAHRFNLTLRQQVLLYEEAGEPREL